MSWTPALQALWRRIEAHEFDPAQPLSFTRRLARDRGWSMAYARGAVAEYGRFAFLAVVAGAPMTPSEQVDEVWHLHLTYSRDYWNVWCNEVLQARLHHDPTTGGPVEQARYRQQYAATLAAYEGWFGPPPEAFWPATHERFRARPRYRVLDTERWLAVPKPLRWLPLGWFRRAE